MTITDTNESASMDHVTSSTIQCAQRVVNSADKNSTRNILSNTPSPYSETPELSSQSRIQSFNKEESNVGLDKMDLAEFEVCLLLAFYLANFLCIYVYICFNTKQVIFKIVFSAFSLHFIHSYLLALFF